jgi:hypothetical protein
MGMPPYCCGVVVGEVEDEPVPWGFGELPKPGEPFVMLPADWPPAPELLLTTVRSASGS